MHSSEPLDLEPYDELLDRQLWTHFATRLRWDKTLSARRREDPANAQALVEDLVMRERESEKDDIPPIIDMDISNEEIGGSTLHSRSSLPLSCLHSCTASVERLETIAGLHGKSVALLQSWKDVSTSNVTDVIV
jgi:hypothetical protein